eukprot:m.757063 g.757063  ORF g.757063 m.757063 type:complete len:581 (+) comp23187_c0_seq3:190-1932(+)
MPITTTTTTTVTTCSPDGKVNTVTTTSSTSSQPKSAAAPKSAHVDYDVVTVGAGFSGLYLLKAAHDLGLSIRCFETAKGVGGTWWWNRYPGAKVDVESKQYSYTWATEVEKSWQWKHRYGHQGEIQAYLDTVAETYDLKKDIQFETSVVSAVWNEKTSLWTISTSDGASCTARWFIMATGCLSKFNKPKIAGASKFKGTVLTTYDFPEEGFDFSGKKVAVIGSGSTAVQFISEVAKDESTHLTVFQRTANFVSLAGDSKREPYAYDEKVAAWKKASQRETDFGMDVNANTMPFAEQGKEAFLQGVAERYGRGGFEFMGQSPDIVIPSAGSNEEMARFCRKKIRETVKDQKVAASLCPKIVFGSKRVCIADGYYEKYNQPNVTLVDLQGKSIEEITETGVKGPDGTVYEADVILYATGFDAMTGAILNIDIQGKNGTTIKEAWANGPATFLGLGVHNFPNMFMVTGPQSPSVLANMVSPIEHHVEWILSCIVWMKDNHKTTIEAEKDSQEQWGTFTESIAAMTVCKCSTSQLCNSFVLYTCKQHRTWKVLLHPVASCDLIRMLVHCDLHTDLRAFNSTTQQ